MPSLLIVYHTDTGGTLQMADAAKSAALDAEPSIAVNLLHADAANSADLLAADGYVFATPENLAAISGVLKTFFDRTYYPVLDRLVARPYASV